MNPVIVRGVEIGAGKPKICVPIIEKTSDDIVKMVRQIIDKPVDLVEWRLDWFTDVFKCEALIGTARILRETVGNVPVLCTFRTSNEGGEQYIDQDTYYKLYEELIISNVVDMIDVELDMGNSVVERLIHKAHENNVKVILSNHNFHKTPSKEIIVERLCSMQELGADIAKIAVMPCSETDVMTLMSATVEMKKEHYRTPVISMSMAGMGAVSRVAGSLMGSAVTFGTVSKASAPGQIEVDRLAEFLEILDY